MFVSLWLYQKGWIKTNSIQTVSKKLATAWSNLKWVKVVTFTIACLWAHKCPRLLVREDLFPQIDLWPFSLSVIMFCMMFTSTQTTFYIFNVSEPMRSWQPCRSPASQRWQSFRLCCGRPKWRCPPWRGLWKRRREKTASLRRSVMISSLGLANEPLCLLNLQKPWHFAFQILSTVHLGSI